MEGDLGGGTHTPRAVAGSGTPVHFTSEKSLIYLTFDRDKDIYTFGFGGIGDFELPVNQTASCSKGECTFHSDILYEPCPYFTIVAKIPDSGFVLSDVDQVQMSFDGNEQLPSCESLDVKWEFRPAGDFMYYEIPGISVVQWEDDHQALKQSMACWAVAIATMMGWRDRRTYTPSAAMDRLGPTFRRFYDDDKGLPARWEGFLADAAGMTAELGTVMTPAGTLQMLKEHGPISLATACEVPPEGNGPPDHRIWCIHDRILCGIAGHGESGNACVRVIDALEQPARPYWMAFNAFMRYYEGMAADSSWRLLCMHF